MQAHHHYYELRGEFMPAKKSVTKKTSKKTTTKKSATKKSTAKKSATPRTRKKKVFTPVAPSQAFHLADGNQLLHYIELADALAEMEEHVLAHHVGEGRHDFANWIEEVFQDKELAASIQSLTSRQEIRLAIYRHLVHKHLH